MKELKWLINMKWYEVIGFSMVFVFIFGNPFTFKDYKEVYYNMRK